jgi:hypothetical protein
MHLWIGCFATNWNGCPLTHMLPICNVTDRFQCNDAQTHTLRGVGRAVPQESEFSFFYKSKLVMSILWDIVVYTYVNFKG